MKRLLSFILAMALAVSCVQWGAMPLAAWGTEDDSALDVREASVTLTVTQAAAPVAAAPP